MASIPHSLIFLLSIVILSLEDDTDDSSPTLSVDETVFLINSTMIADIDTETNETTTDNSTESTEETREHLRFRKRGTSTLTTTKECKKLTQRQKSRQLEKIGGFNQLYSARNVDEAGVNFGYLIEHTFRKKRVRMRTNGEWEGEEFLSDYVDSFTEDCDELCISIKETLNGMTGNELRLEGKGVFHHGDDPSTVKLKNERMKCSLGSASFIPFDNCTHPGEEEDEGNGQVNLCTLCRGFYRLDPSSCFPSIFNAVHCGDDYDRKCIFDRFNKAHGQCGQSRLVMRILQNGGTEDCEEWQETQVELPVGCECSLFSHSSTLSAVPFLTRT